MIKVNSLVVVESELFWFVLRTKDDERVKFRRRKFRRGKIIYRDDT